MTRNKIYQYNVHVFTIMYMLYIAVKGPQNKYNYNYYVRHNQENILFFIKCWGTANNIYLIISIAILHVK